MKISIGSRTLLAKTCLICGELKDARNFGRVSKIYYNSYCHKCKNETSAVPTTVRHQQRALEVAVRYGQPWTEAELDKLQEMAANGFTGPQMALALNRSVYAVYTMKNKI